LRYCCLKQLSPPCCIVKSNTNGMLDKTRHAGCLAGCNERANFFDLAVLKGDGDLGGRHTNDHTMQNGHCFRCSPQTHFGSRLTRYKPYAALFAAYTLIFLVARAAELTIHIRKLEAATLRPTLR